MSELPNFPSCHVHPQSLDSASTPEAFAEREVELGTGFITCTDHGTLAACRKVYDLGKANNLVPVLGLEAYLRDDDCPILAANGYTKNERGAFVDAPKYMHVTMHALDQPAYECMVRKLSIADERLETTLQKLEEKDRKHGSERKPLFTWADLEELGAHNVTMTTGCMIGVVQRHLMENDDMRTAEAYFAKLKSIVKPGNLYTELNPHDTSKNWVKGVFITLADGQVLQFYDEKKLMTNVGEIQAANLARAWSRSNEHAQCAHAVLKSVKDRRTWREMPEVEIKDVKYVEDFLPNECRPWAPNGDLQAGLNRAMKILARKFGVPVIIGDDSHYALPDEKVVQDVRLAQGGSWRFYGHYHRQSSAEAYAHFRRTLNMKEEEFAGIVDNARSWAGRFKDFVFDTPVSLPTKFYEVRYAEQSWFKDAADRDNSLRYTMQLVRETDRMDWKNPAWVKRLRQEVELLHNNGTLDLLPYFMIDQEVCELYSKAGLLTGPGRGSAAGLLLTYLLGITHVDPLRYELSVDRFLTKDRIESGKLPDIDQDLPHRELLVGDGTKPGWLHERFGDHVAQISVDTTLKLKMAVKDVSRRQRGHVPPEIEIWTKKFEMPPQGVNDYDFVMGYDTDEGHVQGSIEYDQVLKDYVRKYPDDWEIVKKCLGLARQKSRHACAYVIANRPIHEFIPLTTVSEVRVTAYTAASVEAVGGLKMDFLVVNSLNDIGDAIKMIQARSPLGAEAFRPQKLGGKLVPGHRIIPFTTGMQDLWDIWDLPEDQDVFADVATGKTETVFQFNTPGAVQWLQHFGNKRPNGNYAIDSIEAMSAFTSLDRPGALNVELTNPDTGAKHNALVEYARRARGATPSPDVFEFFDRLIPETYGVMVYQEQLQKIYQFLTECSGPEAEEFRSNVAKKKKKKVDAAYTPFIEAASKKIGRENAEAAWKFFLTWAKYGFNKSHSICYSVIGYACAFLKHHYPLEWWCAVLRNASKNEVAEKFWRHAGPMIDLPDVKYSGRNFEIQNDRIRAPVSLLKGVGAKAHDQITAGAPYTDIRDFCEKIEVYRVATGSYVKKMKKQKDKTQPKVLDEKTGKMTFPDVEVEVEVFKKGTSALNRKVVQTLIISGAMDSLFPPEMHLGEQLVEFERVLCEATKQKTVKVDPALWDVGPLRRYQMRKAVLPIFGADLLPAVVGHPDAKNLQRRDGELVFYWVPPKSSRVVTLDVATASQVEELQRADMSDGRSRQVAVVAHVDDVRTFRYGEESRQACEITLDIEGGRFKFMKWAGQDIDLTDQFTSLKAGSIAIVVLNKYKSDRPFVAEDVFVVQDPLDYTADEESEAKEEGESDD